MYREYCCSVSFDSECLSNAAGVTSACSATQGRRVGRPMPCPSRAGPSLPMVERIEGTFDLGMMFVTSETTCEHTNLRSKPWASLVCSYTMCAAASCIRCGALVVGENAMPPVRRMPLCSPRLWSPKLEWSTVGSKIADKCDVVAPATKP